MTLSTRTIRLAAPAALAAVFLSCARPAADKKPAMASPAPSSEKAPAAAPANGEFIEKESGLIYSAPKEPGLLALWPLWKDVRTKSNHGTLTLADVRKVFAKIPVNRTHHGQAETDRVFMAGAVMYTGKAPPTDIGVYLMHALAEESAFDNNPQRNLLWGAAKDGCTEFFHALRGPKGKKFKPSSHVDPEGYITTGEAILHYAKNAATVRAILDSVHISLNNRVSAVKAAPDEIADELMKDPAVAAGVHEAARREARLEAEQALKLAAERKMHDPEPDACLPCCP